MYVTVTLWDKTVLQYSGVYEIKQVTGFVVLVFDDARKRRVWFRRALVSMIETENEE